LLESTGGLIIQDHIILANTGAVGDINGGIIEEVDGHLGELVLLGCRAWDKSIDQSLELPGAVGRLELERSTIEGLSDGERGERGRSIHCFQLQMAALL